MAKPGFWEDTFEKLTELGVSTAKKTTQSLKQTLDPLQMLDQVTGRQGGDKGIEQLEKGKGKKPNHTPLDFKKLQDKYENQDKQKTEVLRQRLFQMVKGADEKLLMEQRQKEMQKKQTETYEEMEKKRKEEEKKKQLDLQAGAPQGKIRRSIFSPKKVAKREQAEFKPAAGKQ
jgi:hypothetical protein